MMMRRTTRAAGTLVQDLLLRKKEARTFPRILSGCHRYFSSSSSSSSSSSRHDDDGNERWSFPQPLPPPTKQELYDNGLPMLHRASLHANNEFLTGWAHHDGTVDLVTYKDVLLRSTIISNRILLSATSSNNNKETTTMSDDDVTTSSSQPRNFVAHLNVPGWEYVATQWGAWGAGFGSVPIALSQKVPEIEHVLEQANPRYIIAGGNCSLSDDHENDTNENSNINLSHVPPNRAELLQAAENVFMRDRVVTLKDIFTTHRSSSNKEEQQQDEGALASSFRLGNGGVVKSLDEPALLLFTSGTTGKPKAALISHRNIYHQVTDLCAAWEWESSDVALHLLPLHHVHGVINLLSCAAYAGAQLQFQPFCAETLWKQWATPANVTNLPSILMAVPTIYAKLLEAADKLPKETIEAAVRNTLNPMRLMVSGSAALPVSTLERWRELTMGHTLLERYGMTEFAMALSNPYREDEDKQQRQRRRPGYVGLPLPSVKVRIVDQETNEVIETPGVSGELQVKGATVFREYLNRPDATREAFTEDGYFKTGDIALYDGGDTQSYRILGRASVDIIKMGGNKLSALEIERELLEHPHVAEVVVLGVPDDIWGERVAMICRLKPNIKKQFTLEELRHWASDRLSNEKVPSLLRVVDEIPKNAMGKVNKKNLADLFP